MSVTLNLTVIAGYFFNCVIVCRSFVLYIPFVFFFGLQRANCILFLCEGHTPYSKMNEGVVSKETVVLRRWGSSIQKFGFINGVDNVNWPPYRDSKSSKLLESLYKLRAFRISVRWPIYIINSVDKTKLLQNGR